MSGARHGDKSIANDPRGPSAQARSGARHGDKSITNDPQPPSACLTADALASSEQRMLASAVASLLLGLPAAPTFVVAPLPSGATEVAFDHIGSVNRFTLAVPPSA